jgi:hypothetical protein
MFTRRAVRVGPFIFRHDAFRRDGFFRVEHGEGMMRESRRCDRDRKHRAKAASFEIHRRSPALMTVELATPQEESKSDANYTAGRRFLTSRCTIMVQPSLRL